MTKKHNFLSQGNLKLLPLSDQLKKNNTKYNYIDVKYELSKKKKMITFKFQLLKQNQLKRLKYSLQIFYFKSCLYLLVRMFSFDNTIKYKYIWHKINLLL